MFGSQIEKWYSNLSLFLVFDPLSVTTVSASDTTVYHILCSISDVRKLRRTHASTDESTRVVGTLILILGFGTNNFPAGQIIIKLLAVHCSTWRVCQAFEKDEIKTWISLIKTAVGKLSKMSASWNIFANGTSKHLCCILGYKKHRRLQISWCRK